MPYFNWRKTPASPQKVSSAPPESQTHGQESLDVALSSSKSRGHTRSCSDEDVSHTHSPSRMLSMFHFNMHKSGRGVASNKRSASQLHQSDEAGGPLDTSACVADPAPLSVSPSRLQRSECCGDSGQAAAKSSGNPASAKEETADGGHSDSESTSASSEETSKAQDPQLGARDVQQDDPLADQLAVPPATSRHENDTQRHSSRKHRWKYHNKQETRGGGYFDFQPQQRDMWLQRDVASPVNRRLSNSWSPNKPSAVHMRAGGAQLRRSSAFEPTHSSLVSIPAPSRRSQCGGPACGPLPRSASSGRSIYCRGFPPATQRRSSSLQIQAPHLITEDFTSPVLDSTVELITSQNLNDVDVVQLGCRSPSSAFMHSVGHRRGTQSSTGTVGTADTAETAGTAGPIDATGQVTSSRPGVVGSASSKLSGESFSKAIDSGRKSISFYSYSDLVNFEKSSKLSRDLVMSPATARSSSVSTGGVSDTGLAVNTGSPAHAGIHASGASRSPDGKTHAVGFVGTMSSSVSAASPPSTTDDNCDLFSMSSEPEDNVNSISSNGNEAVDIVSDWVPCTKSSREQAPTIGTPLEVCFSRGANFEGGGLDAVLSGDQDESNLASQTNRESGKAVNVCSAKDLLQLRSRELHNSFGAN